MFHSEISCKGVDTGGGGALGAEAPQIFSFTLYFIGNNCWLVSSIDFYQSKTSQIYENFSSKVHFYDIFNNRTENFLALHAQWSSSPPHYKLCLRPSILSINYVMIQSKIMNSVLFNSLLIVSIFSNTDITSAQNNNCNACNCRFNNVQVWTSWFELRSPLSREMKQVRNFCPLLGYIQHSL